MSNDFPFGFGVGPGGEPPGGPGGQGGAPGPGGFDMGSLGAALQQLGAMLQAGQAAGDTGPVNWAMVTDIARKTLVQAGDPSVSDAERRVVADSMRLADLWLDAAVTFPATSGEPEAWSRSEWVEATLPVWRTIVEPIAEQVQGTLGSMMPSGEASLDVSTLNDNLPEQLRAMLPDGIPPEMASMLGPMMGMMRGLSVAAFSMQLGQALAALASEVVGSADIGIPLTAPARPAMLPRNVAAFGEGLGLPAEDVRLYLSLREAAHQRLFAHVAWLRPRVIGAVEEYARGIRVDQSRLAEAMDGIDVSRPEALQELMSSGLLEPEDSDEQRAAIARLETLLALVEGWVDDAVDTAMAERLPSSAQLRETMRRRRAAGGPAEKTFSTLVGMELRPRLLREAATLFAIVRAGKGAEARDGLWAHPDLLPGPADLADPLGFVEDSSTDLEFGPERE